MRLMIAAVCALALGLAAPAIADARAIVDLEDGVAVYRGGPADNDMTARAPGFESTWTDTRPPIAGPGCVRTGAAVTCPSVSMDARLGFGDDRADITGSGESVATVTGGFGDDRIRSAAGDNFVFAGWGDDRVTITNEGRGSARGEEGDDTLLGDEGQSQLFGNRGRDLVVGSASATLLDGGVGADDLVKYFGGGEVYGGDGRDVLVARFAAADRLDGGRDGDWIVGAAGSDTAVGDGGDDVIDVSGDEGEGPDAVQCGSGEDTVYADPDDLVAADCETRVDGSMPSTRRVDDAIAAADDLLANPNPLQ
jgi:hypothetical protein